LDFSDSLAEAAFRTEVREWIRINGPRFVPPPNGTEAEVTRIARAWQAARASAGYAGFGLPESIGGRPGSATEEVIFLEEQRHHPMARVEIMTLGTGMALPTIIAHGRPEHLAALGRSTVRGDTIWCQLFSEPAAGSDLAGIRTSAVPDGDRWIVNGQKVWTSGALFADWGLLLARTDPTVPKHKGLTYFLLDMKSAGVMVRPLRQLGGRTEFNEVFFTDVSVPDSMRLGAVGAGWAVAMTTLSNERLALTGDAAVGRDLVAPLLRLAKRTLSPAGGPLIDDVGFRERLASYYAAVAGVEHIRARITTALSRGHNPGPEATVGKMTLTRMLQSMATFGMDLAGIVGSVIDPSSDPDLHEIQQGLLLAPGYRMGGGTEEIGKNIIAERVLGLPPDVRIDKDVPFNKVVTRPARLPPMQDAPAPDGASHQ
jgi:alkylation response protein AidB-like acyl-CoA dehydrogenase